MLINIRPGFKASTRGLFKSQCLSGSCEEPVEPQPHLWNGRPGRVSLAPTHTRFSKILMLTLMPPLTLLAPGTCCVLIEDLALSL